MVRNPGMVSFVIDIGDPAVLQIGSIIWIVRDSRRTREELVSIGHIAEDNAMEASNAADSFIRNHAGVSDHVRFELAVRAVFGVGTVVEAAVGERSRL